jgi:transposase
MLFSINGYGGSLLAMMGLQTRSESLFYYFRIEDHIPEDHLLRLVDRHIDLAFVRECLKASYSHTGRPSIDPEVLLRSLLIGYLYGITSERRLVEDVGMNLAYAGLLASASIKKFRITRHSPRIGTAVFRNRRSSSNCSSSSSSSA